MQRHHYTEEFILNCCILSLGVKAGPEAT